MLGEILGRRAGETWTELGRFLDARTDSEGPLRAPPEGLSDVNCGLEADAAVPGRAKAGEGNDWKLGVAVDESTAGVV